MKYKKKYSLFSVLLIVTLLFQTPIDAHRYPPRSSQEDIQNAVWAGIALAGAATGVYALGRWCGWWGPPSNELLLERCRHSIDKARTYQPMLRLIDRAYKQHSDVTNYFDEMLLYDLAVAKGRSVSVERLIEDVKSQITELKSNYAAIDQRMYELSTHEQWHELQYMHDCMVESAKRIKDCTFELELLSTLLVEHRSYFRIFETEDVLAREYRRELAILQQYADDNYVLTKALRSCVLSQYAGAFALIDFAKKIKHAVHSLERALEHPAYNYASRISYARSLLGSLQHIQEVIVSDREYIRLLSEHDRAQRDKERLRLERERVHTEQRIAAAKEREARAKEREARAKEKQNRIKERKMYENHMQYR